VYYCAYTTMINAIQEEKRIKGSSRMDKVHLISQQNPEWKDLWQTEFS
jgi:putative endonuclease